MVGVGCIRVDLESIENDLQIYKKKVIYTLSIKPHQLEQSRRFPCYFR